MSKKAKAGKLHKSGDGQQGTHWNYVCENEPIEDCMIEGFFSTFRNNFLPGDLLTACEMKDDRVVAICELIVVARSALDIEVQKRHGGIQRFDLPETEEEDVPESKSETYIDGDGYVKWNPGKQMHQVFVKDKLIAETKDKAEAQAIARGDVALTA